MPPQTNKTPMAMKPSKSIIDLSVFILKKVKTKNIGGNNNIAFGIRA